ncbi:MULTISPECIES: rhodanese-like domain-containing protein [Paenibacillus]|uniref:rhodanese-like domain-containing protein n=1 Tax=Paenibacillus TaxID=44249 RepID=UPI0022B8E43B|nr:rhodanese-like domain-containing protein [Paenibacillus caseinilyticus]MCZ8518241.1 rhodanese-like domain-containing protein [Paenibacillus caseinilyticus]
MSILIALLVICIWGAVRSWMPVRGLAFVDEEAMRRMPSYAATLKMVDIRDASDYRENPVSGAVNISLGRLPYVWHKELKSSEPVLILSDSRRKSIKAARVLKKHGFGELYALRSRACPCPSPCYRT